MALKKEKNFTSEGGGLAKERNAVTDAAKKGIDRNVAVDTTKKDMDRNVVTDTLQRGLDWIAEQRAKAEQNQKRSNRDIGKVFPAKVDAAEDATTEERLGDGTDLNMLQTGTYTPGSAPAAEQAATTSPAVAARQRVASDYDRAMAALSEMEKSPPTYAGGYDDQINELYAKITGRGDFEYKLDEDALWQQLKDDYTRMGRQAMQDTMGRAAALTGGYGSSYGQMAGQSAYDQYLTQLMDVAPELAEAAYQRYQDEGTELRKDLDYLLSRDADAYSRYNDDYTRYLKERDYLTDRADKLYGRQEGNRAYLDALMQMGYDPTDEEIANAGMTPEQYQAIVDYYAAQAAGRSGGGSAVADEGTEIGPGASMKLAARKTTLRNKSKTKDKNVTYGSGLPEQQMKPLTEAIRSAENAEAAMEIYNKITDYTFQQMSKEQLEQLDKAMRSRGA